MSENNNDAVPSTNPPEEETKTVANIPPDFPEPPADADPAAAMAPAKEVAPDPFTHAAEETEAGPQVGPAGNEAVAKEEQQRKLMLGQTKHGAVDVFDTFVEEPEDLEGDAGGPVPSTNAQLEYEYTSAPKDALDYAKERFAGDESVLFHAEQGEHVDKRIRAYSHEAIFTTPAGRFWNETLINASMHSAFLVGEHRAAAQREKADWRQLVDVENGFVGMSKPRFKETGVIPATGQKAMQRVRSLLGAGSIIQIPLWHSGFWITLKAPSDSHLIELHRRMTEDKISYGRQTLGMSFSNEQSYQVSWLFEFCMDYIHESSAIFEGNRVDMRRYIKAQDLSALLWGLAALIWPRGFSYYRSLTTVDGIKNSNVIGGLLDVTKLYWTDRNMLTASQRKHMAVRRQRVHTVESIVAYQKQFELHGGRWCKINDDVSLLLQQPTVEDQVIEGEKWIAGLVNMIDATFTTAMPDAETRNDLVNLHTRATLMRRYSPWIKAVITGGGTPDEHFYDDEEVIVDTLEALAGLDVDMSIRQNLENDVKKLIDDTTVSMVAMPETDGKNTKIPRFENLIPINVIQTFFILLAQRVQRLATV